MSAATTFGPMIHSYSRAQALEDGVLVDLSTHARDFGFALPLAITCDAYAAAISLTESAITAGFDEAERACDVLRALRSAIHAAPFGASRVRYRMDVVRERVFPLIVELVAVCAPGDDADPVITIMLPGED